MKRTILTLTAVAALTLAGCGGSSDAQSSGGSQDRQAQAGQRGPGGFPDGSGEVVELSGSTAQVQGQAGQVAVTWTDDTTFTRQVAGSAGDVTVGSCVMVQPTDGSSDSDDVAASTVRIIAATDGGCTMGAGQRPDGATPPSGAPQDAPEGSRPSGAPDGQGGPAGMRGAFGEVTELTDTGFVVTSTQPGAEDSTTVTVTTSDATDYTTTAAASASAMKVGACVTSRGDTDDTGAITATTIAISDAVDGECATFGGGFGRGEQAGDGS